MTTILRSSTSRFNVQMVTDLNNSEIRYKKFMYFPDRGCVHTLLTFYVYATALLDSPGGLGSAAKHVGVTVIYTVRESESRIKSTIHIFVYCTTAISVHADCRVHILTVACNSSVLFISSFQITPCECPCIAARQ